MSALLKTSMGCSAGAGRFLRHRSILIGSFLACALVLLVAMTAAASASAEGNGKNIKLLNPGERLNVYGKACVPFVMRRTERKVKVRCLFGGPKIPKTPEASATQVPDGGLNIALQMGDVLVIKQANCGLRIKGATADALFVQCKVLKLRGPIIIPLAPGAS